MNPTDSLTLLQRALDMAYRQGLADGQAASRATIDSLQALVPASSAWWHSPLAGFIAGAIGAVAFLGLFLLFDHLLRNVEAMKL